MSLKDFVIVKKLGSGAYSSVYKVERIIDKELYALKKINFIALNQKQKQNALNQVRILASIKHPNIIGYKQVFFDQSSKSLCIVMQYADKGDLHQKILNKRQNNQNFNEDQIWETFIQICKALKTLHESNVMHRDIKSANILLFQNGEVKLADLNVSKISERGLCQTQTGTPYYASPEVWKDQPYGPKSDIWSLGCIIYQMSTLSPPFQAQDMQGLYKKVTKGQYKKLPQNYSSGLSDLIRLLLQTNCHKRPSCQKLLNMKMITKRLHIKQRSITQNNTKFLKTIRTPLSLQKLNENLPKSNYLNIKTEPNLEQYEAPQFQQLAPLRSPVFKKLKGRHINSITLKQKKLGYKSNLITNKQIIQGARLELSLIKSNKHSSSKSKSGTKLLRTKLQSIMHPHSSVQQVKQTMLIKPIKKRVNHVQLIKKAYLGK